MSDFTIKYRPERSNGNDDAMSREAWMRIMTEDSHYLVGWGCWTNPLVHEH